MKILDENTIPFIIVTAVFELSSIGQTKILLLAVPATWIGNRVERVLSLSSCFGTIDRQQK